ncbi:MAG: DUF1614 domain-containing protein [Fuerstiella sp.]
MSDIRFQNRPVLPAIGCGTLLLLSLFLCLLPFVLVDAMQEAFSRLHLPAFAAFPALVGIFAGSLINIPLYRVARTTEQPELLGGPFLIGAFAPRFRRMRTETIVAVNLGGCVIPLLIAIWQVIHLFAASAPAWTALVIATSANIYVCFKAARPVPGVGIMMPGFVSPLTAVAVTWLMLSADSPDRASVAFVAGILGPLIGADVLNLRTLERLSTGVLSIGGAGTFDGIVLSGVLAALLV